MNTSSSRVRWTKNLESYFKELGEQSLCLSMLHKSAEAIYSSKAQWIDLPVIVLSTLCGSLTLSAKSLFGEANEENALKVVGGLSLLSGVLGTIQAYFSFSRRAENHRNSYLEYAKLYRFVKVELGLPRGQRIQAKDLIKIVNDSFERLNELSQLIPEKTLSAFRAKYKKNPLKKPPIVNGLEEITIFVPESDEESSDSDDSDPRSKRRKRRERQERDQDIQAALARAKTMEDLLRRPTLAQEPLGEISKTETSLRNTLGSAARLFGQAQTTTTAASKRAEMTALGMMQSESNAQQQMQQQMQQQAQEVAADAVASVLHQAIDNVVESAENKGEE